jgi:hypothetical protein
VGLSAAHATTAAVAFALALAVGRLAGSRIVGVISTPSLFVASAVVALVGFLIHWGTSHAFVASWAFSFSASASPLLFRSLSATQSGDHRLAVQHPFRMRKGPYLTPKNPKRIFSEVTTSPKDE